MYLVYVFDGYAMELLDEFRTYKEALQFVRMNRHNYGGELSIEPEDVTGIRFYEWQDSHRHAFKCK